MRTTVRVDDELLERLKAQAQEEGVSLARLMNRTLKAGLHASTTGRPKRPPFRERVHGFGPPQVPLDKALALAAVLEDEEILRKLALRK